MKQATSEILLSASALGPGERARMKCPACGGGTSGEDSLSLALSEEGTVMWNCFRATCSFSGHRGGARVDSRKRFTPRTQSVRPYRGELRHLEPEEEQFLLERIGWTEEHRAMARPMYAPEESRYALPIFGPMGTRRGYVLRSYDDVKTKALTRLELPEPHMSWYMHKSDTPVVVVEDIPSAVRVALYSNALALNGTGVSPGYANEIAAHTRSVVWALDADATGEAIKLHRKFGMLFDNSRIQILECDFKDMPEKEIKEMLE